MSSVLTAVALFQVGAMKEPALPQHVSSSVADLDNTKISFTKLKIRFFRPAEERH